MATPIVIPDEIMERLQTLARPFVDTTPLAVVLRGIECLEKQEKRPASGLPQNTYVLPDRPNVRFTRILSAEIGDETLVRTTWNDLYRRVHEKALEMLGSFEALSAISRAGLVQGHRTDAGYVYLPSHDMSLQGTDANTALLIIYQILIKLGLALRIEVEWRDKEEAERPGEKATILWNGPGAKPLQ